VAKTDEIITAQEAAGTKVAVIFQHGLHRREEFRSHSCISGIVELVVVGAPSTTLGWRLVNPAMPAEWTVSLGEANEQLEDRHRVGRERMDAFAMRSHRLAEEGWNAGFFDDLTTAVLGTDLARDENIRAGTSAEKMAALKPVFAPTERSPPAMPLR
jgi:acetyl-CoA acetyltransferase